MSSNSIRGIQGNRGGMSHDEAAFLFAQRREMNAQVVRESAALQVEAGAPSSSAPRQECLSVPTPAAPARQPRRVLPSRDAGPLRAEVLNRDTRRPSLAATLYSAMTILGTASLTLTLVFAVAVINTP